MCVPCSPDVPLALPCAKPSPATASSSIPGELRLGPLGTLVQL